MSEKKNEIIAAIGRELPNMTENEKNYLMGFLEGFAANAGTKRLAVERTGA